MENKSHAMAAGTFVLVVTLMLVSLVIWLTRDKGKYQNYELSTRDAITGLQPQAAVRYKGVGVGKVTSISFDHQAKGNVLIRIQVEDKTPLGPTTYATLAYQGVTGLAYVLLDDAGAPQARQEPGEDGLPRLPLVTSQLGKMTEQAPELLAQINEATVRINQTLSDDNQKRLSLLLSNLAKVSENSAQLTASLNQTVQTRLDPALAAVPALAHEATVTLKGLQGTATDLGRMSNALTQTAQRLNDKDGPIDRIAQSADAFSHVVDTLGSTTLPRVNRVAEDASRTVRQLGRTATGLNDNPQSLLFGAGQMLPGPGEPGFTPPPVVVRP
ncbi:MlaD family protein [Curvibacter sp. RS43]|uniref:MlaD family protein n=1 Tax=Curvibacter microcysteis TaxID=3026419 RepID=A0ABT5MBJ8_9BURK|nr:MULTISPECIES: MlaD family protein [unclassified Curvibacter]MDD0811254.1 MlaD family protein [Curvibacter sp. RS43]MDD0813775.1 MlaD family protein [Curvibacter sp. HBC28]